MTRALVLVAAMVAVAGAYPMTLPVRTAAQRAAIEQAFRARNREHWITVEVDARGFVSHAVTDDPNLVPSAQWTASDLERIRSFLRGNIDLTGIGARVIADVEQDGVLIYGLHGARLAKISLERVVELGHPPELEIRSSFEIAGTPSLEPEAVTRTLVGTSVQDRTDYGKGRPMFTRKRTLVLRAADIHTYSVVHADGARVRVLYCSEPRVDPLPADPGWGDVSLVGQHFEPSVLRIVDAITGERLAIAAASCDALSNVRD